MLRDFNATRHKYLTHEWALQKGIQGQESQVKVTELITTYNILYKS